MIEVEHLTRRYGALTAVDDVSFQIQPGEVVGLLGHNGAGKTTIMKMITGFLEPTSGDIRVDALRIGPDTSAIQSRIGYLPENCPVWPDMTVIDYLDYQAGLHGVAAPDRPAAIASAIKRTALVDRADALISTLSRGYRQRVGVAQALLHKPAILILDEPTNGLDPTQILHMRQLIRDLATSATVIISTHILQEVQAVCQRVLIMRGGKLVVDARMDELSTGAGLLVDVDRDAADALRGMAAVRAVEAQEAADSHFSYRVDAPLDSAPDIASSLVGAGFRLYALQTRHRTLETVFAEVNGEAAHV